MFATVKNRVMAVMDRLGFLMTDPTIRRVQVPLDHDRSLTFGPFEGSIFWGKKNVNEVISFNF